VRRRVKNPIDITGVEPIPQTADIREPPEAIIARAAIVGISDKIDIGLGGVAAHRVTGGLGGVGVAPGDPANVHHVLDALGRLAGAAGVFAVELRDVAGGGSHLAVGELGDHDLGFGVDGVCVDVVPAFAEAVFVGFARDRALRRGRWGRGGRRCAGGWGRGCGGGCGTGVCGGLGAVVAIQGCAAAGDGGGQKGSRRAAAVAVVCVGAGLLIRVDDVVAAGDAALARDVCGGCGGGGGGDGTAGEGGVGAFGVGDAGAGHGGEGGKVRDTGGADIAVAPAKVTNISDERR